MFLNKSFYDDSVDACDFFLFHLRFFLNMFSMKIVLLAFSRYKFELGEDVVLTLSNVLGAVYPTLRQLDSHTVLYATCIWHWRDMLISFQFDRRHLNIIFNFKYCHSNNITLFWFNVIFLTLNKSVWLWNRMIIELRYPLYVFLDKM